MSATRQQSPLPTSPPEVATPAMVRRRGRQVFSQDQWWALANGLKLSTREFQIVQHLFDDETEAAIAKQLEISSHTVHTYFERLYRKLGVCSRGELMVRVFSEHQALLRAG
jgi:DNA-binding NarL/FixJ family response regulator